MKYLFHILSLLLLPATCTFAQNQIKPVRTLSAAASHIAVDHLDNLYIVSQGNQLKKFNAKGDSVSVYNDVRRYGKLSFVDVSNPLKLLLYYKDFSTIVILDRFLAVRTTIDLRRQNILQTSAVGLSYDNNIWLFDEYENKLKKVNEEGTVLFETADFRQLFQNTIVPQQIIDQNNTIHLYDVKSGVYLFDHFGTFRKKLAVTNWKYIGIFDKYIYGIAGDHTFGYYNTTTLLSAQKALPVQLNGSYNYHVANNKLFAWTKDTLHIYTYPF